ncbi:GNAT family N-acetyltransferase [Streptomyces sp. NPDC005438]|uniref:GNAT family N-acetyltransferase n=1 Tax=Streptomyces sp. NPDC005438 TaxID=3156880 RepID=UPI0033AD5614
MTVEIRTPAEDEFAHWLRTVGVGFHNAKRLSDEKVGLRREQWRLEELQGAFDGDQCVATFRRFPQLLTVPGGVRLGASAISAVTVRPTHRRRGLLSRMMTNELHDARERGDALATLIASEYPIYGRFGFGPAAWHHDYEVEVHRTGLPATSGQPEDGGRLEQVELSQVREIGPELHDRVARLPQAQGTVSRDAAFWSKVTGEHEGRDEPFTPRFYVVYRDEHGTPQGLVSHTSEHDWADDVPRHTLRVLDLFGTSPRAEAALWRYLMSVDWVSTVRAQRRPVDDLLPLLVPDSRSVHVRGRADFLWLRPLDVPAMLEARGYERPGSLVLRVVDPAGLAEGTFRLEADTDGARCTATGREPELTLGVGELASLYLGGESAARLGAVGRVDEERAGALVSADGLFGTSRQPWCQDVF